MAIIQAHQPCDKCGSSDARAFNDDGSSYCFSCQDHSGRSGGQRMTTPTPTSFISLHLLLCPTVVHFHGYNGLWNGFLGSICNYRCRKLRNQFKSHRRHIHSKHGKRFAERYYGPLPGVKCEIHLCQRRHCYRRCCDAYNLLGHFRPSRNLWSGFRFLRGIKKPSEVCTSKGLL